jgi:hypothetical protein
MCMQQQMRISISYLVETRNTLLKHAHISATIIYYDTSQKLMSNNFPINDIVMYVDVQIIDVKSTNEY